SRDWSSDVCSSDLPRTAEREARPTPGKPDHTELENWILRDRKAEPRRPRPGRRVGRDPSTRADISRPGIWERIERTEEYSDAVNSERSNGLRRRYDGRPILYPSQSL